jgi:hypothetical protein
MSENRLGGGSAWPATVAGTAFNQCSCSRRHQHSLNFATEKRRPEVGKPADRAWLTSDITAQLWDQRSSLIRRSQGAISNAV